MRRLRHSVVHHMSLKRIRRHRKMMRTIKQRERERRLVFFHQKNGLS